MEKTIEIEKTLTGNKFKVTDDEFAYWCEAMIEIFDKTGVNKDIFAHPDRAYKLAKQIEVISGFTKDERIKYYTMAKMAMTQLCRDIVYIADFDTYIVTETQISFFGHKAGEVADYIGDATWFGSLIKDTVADALNNGTTIKGLNKEQVKRVCIYRQLLLDECGVDKIGDVLPYAKAALYTYQAALAELDADEIYTNPGFTKGYTVLSGFGVEEIKKYYTTYGYNYTNDLNKNSGELRNGIESVWRGKLKNAGEIQETTTAEFQNWIKKTIKGQAEKDAGFTIDEINNLDSEAQGEVKEPRVDPDKDTVFKQPQNTTAVAKNDEDETISDVEKVLDDAGEFLKEGTIEEFLFTDELQEFSQNLYSLLLGIGIVVAVIVGMIIGIKLMMASAGEKADAKKLLVPYVVGCVIIFGGFGIWQFVVTLIQGL